MICFDLSDIIILVVKIMHKFGKISSGLSKIKNIITRGPQKSEGKKGSFGVKNRDIKQLKTKESGVALAQMKVETQVQPRKSISQRSVMTLNNSKKDISSEALKSHLNMPSEINQEATPQKASDSLQFKHGSVDKFFKEADAYVDKFVDHALEGYGDFDKKMFKMSLSEQVKDNIETLKDGTLKSFCAEKLSQFRKELITEVRVENYEQIEFIPEENLKRYPELKSADTFNEPVPKSGSSNKEANKSQSQSAAQTAKAKRPLPPRPARGDLQGVKTPPSKQKEPPAVPKKETNLPQGQKGKNISAPMQRSNVNVRIERKYIGPQRESQSTTQTPKAKPPPKFTPYTPPAPEKGPPPLPPRDDD